MNQNLNQTLQLEIHKLKNLPVLPEASLRILDAINDPDISIDKLADVLSLSPSLVARLLGLANSAYFGQTKQISDVRTAIFQVLGLELVKSLSLGIVLNVQFDTRKCQTFDTEYFWLRSLLTAVAAQKLAGPHLLEQFSPSTVYTSGLLLYIGILVLGYLVPEELNSILQQCSSDRACVGEEIRSHLGESHYHLGFILLQKWHLSPVYLSVLNHFEDSGYAGDEKPLIDLLKLCRRLSFILLDQEEPDIAPLEASCEEFSIPFADLTRVVADLVKSREGLQKLATIMGS